MVLLNIPYRDYTCTLCTLLYELEDMNMCFDTIEQLDKDISFGHDFYTSGQNRYISTTFIRQMDKTNRF